MLFFESAPKTFGLHLDCIWRRELVACNPNGNWRFRPAIVCAICMLAAFELAAQFGFSVYIGDATFYCIAFTFLVAIFIALYLVANDKAWRAGVPSALAVALQTLGGAADSRAKIVSSHH